MTQIQNPKHRGDPPAFRPNGIIIGGQRFMQRSGTTAAMFWSLDIEIWDLPALLNRLLRIYDIARQCYLPKQHGHNFNQII
jgi:hypothetical protein